MATTQIEEKPRIITPRNTRRNEIIAILLLAFGLLLALCLVSAAFYPNDPSWNSAGQTETHNLAGTIGANVAAALFQFVGLAAYLLPVLLFAAAWRRFRTRTMHAAFSSMIGLVMLVLAASALLSIAKLHPLFDESVPPGESREIAAYAGDASLVVINNASHTFNAIHPLVDIPGELSIAAAVTSRFVNVYA